ncbi:MAG: ABC transporter ATP-binding protein [Deinococcales bacterium]|jgi:ABC-2 type transport system ATP-binding protein
MTIPTRSADRGSPAGSAPSGHGGAIAELRNVRKHYGEVQALRGVDLQVHAGEVLALLGPNGAGKTTTVGLLLGLLKPTSGAVTLFGGDPESTAAKVRVGAMLQISGVPATLTPREHLDLFASYYPAPLPVARALELGSLTEVADRPYGKLSGGQKQRLHFALALVGNPDLLFLDEPTTGMDVTARRGFWEQVRAFIGSGRTVVLTTHYMEEADALADRIVVIDHGAIIAQGTPAQIKSRTAGRRIRCVTALDPAFIRDLPGVVSVEAGGAALEILAQAAEPVVLELLRRDPGLHDLEVGGAGLEDAFLALTGRSEP